MAYINKDTIELVKNRVTVQDYMRKIVIPELGSYYSQYPGDFTYRDVAQCPVHQEDTPSFRWFPETNSCYCYACKFGGDIIALHRKFMEVNKNTEVNFFEAVEFLKATFIDNVEYVKTIKTREGIQEVKYKFGADSKQKAALINIESSGVDISRYSMILRKADDRLLKNIEMDSSKKIECYEYIELIDTLLEHNKISAVVARQKIIDKMKLNGISL